MNHPHLKDHIVNMPQTDIDASQQALNSLAADGNSLDKPMVLDFDNDGVALMWAIDRDLEGNCPIAG